MSETLADKLSRELSQAANLTTVPAGAFLGMWLTGGVDVAAWTAFAPLCVSAALLIGSFIADDIAVTATFARYARAKSATTPASAG